MSNVEAYKELATLQAAVSVPKGQVNKFGNYAYRSCEDILQAVKPHLNGAVILVSDEIKLIGDRFYIQATAKYIFGEIVIENTAFAREPAIKKGMDESQITGTASSYARKYALNGLLLIDDNKDADTMNNKEDGNCSSTTVKPHPNSKEAQAEKQRRREAHPTIALFSALLNDHARASEAVEMWREMQGDAPPDEHSEEQKALHGVMNMVEKNRLKAVLFESPREAAA